MATPVVSNVYDCSGELAAAVASVEAVVSYLMVYHVINLTCSSEGLYCDGSLKLLMMYFLHSENLISS